MKPSPHIRRPYTGPVVDYNDIGPWSTEAIRFRYEAAARMHGSVIADLVPDTHTESGRTWIYPLICKIIPLIQSGDPAAADVGIAFIEEDDFFVFGRILKYDTARALRRVPLTPVQQERIRQRVVAMLLAGNVPREFVEYRRLFIVIGPGELWTTLESQIDRQNPYVLRHYRLLERALHLTDSNSCR